MNWLGWMAPRVLERPPSTIPFGRTDFQSVRTDWKSVLPLAVACGASLNDGDCSHCGGVDAIASSTAGGACEALSGNAGSYDPGEVRASAGIVASEVVWTSRRTGSSASRGELSSRKCTRSETVPRRWIGSSGPSTTPSKRPARSQSPASELFAGSRGGSHSRVSGVVRRRGGVLCMERLPRGTEIGWNDGAGEKVADERI